MRTIPDMCLEASVRIHAAVLIILHFSRFFGSVNKGFQMCRLPHVYGWKDELEHVTRTAHDPREGRVVATIRYEWYWIWSLRYNTHSWLMLLDARDSYFQSNPFISLPREIHPDREDGLLYLFGENTEATRLGSSTKNLKWIRNGYGEATLKALEDKPTICSGSTMGEQIAIETYLRAMVNEHDEASVRMTGSDQGFHNVRFGTVSRGKSYISPSLSSSHMPVFISSYFCAG